MEPAHAHLTASLASDTDTHTYMHTACFPCLTQTRRLNNSSVCAVIQMRLAVTRMVHFAFWRAASKACDTRHAPADMPRKQLLVVMVNLKEAACLIMLATQTAEAPRMVKAWNVTTMQLLASLFSSNIWRHQDQRSQQTGSTATTHHVSLLVEALRQPRTSSAINMPTTTTPSSPPTAVPSLPDRSLCEPSERMLSMRSKP